MRVARVLLRETERLPEDHPLWDARASLPRLAIERDGALYDVELLERAYGVGSDSPLASDFHTRVATLRCASLYDLDTRLFRGERPTSARIPPESVMLLAPCDTERASYIHLDLRALPGGGSACRLGQARALLGDRALVSVPDPSSAVRLEVSLGVVVGDDLKRASPAECRESIVGCSILVDWLSPSRLDSSAAHLVTVRGVAGQLGPVLVSPYAFHRPERAVVTVRTDTAELGRSPLSALGISIPEALARASGELEIRSGDLIGVGPIPFDPPLPPVKMHDLLHVAIDGLGLLSGTPVPSNHA